MAYKFNELKKQPVIVANVNNLLERNLVGASIRNYIQTILGNL